MKFCQFDLRIAVSYNVGSLYEWSDDHWGLGRGEEEIERKKE
jgi:hypothetical protein